MVDEFDIHKTVQCPCFKQTVVIEECLKCQYQRFVDNFRVGCGFNDDWHSKQSLVDTTQLPNPRSG